MVQVASVAGRDIPAELETELERLGFRADKPFLKEFWVDCYNKLSPHSIEIERVEHQQFHEIYHFKGPKNNRARIIFYYNGKQQFGKRKLLPNGEFTDSIVNILTQNVGSSVAEVMHTFDKQFLQEFHTLFKSKLVEAAIGITRIREHAYSVEYVLQREGNVVIFKIAYNGQGFITTAMPQKYNCKALHEEVQAYITSISAQ